MLIPVQIAPFAGRTARQTQIEGLRHGGVAQVIRHSMTSFGSGWRGKDAGPRFFHGTTQEFDRFSLDKVKTGTYGKAAYLTERLSEAESYSKMYRGQVPFVGSNIRPVEIRSDRVFEIKESTPIPLQLRLKNPELPRMPVRATLLDLWKAWSKKPGQDWIERLSPMVQDAGYDAMQVPFSGGSHLVVYNPEVIHPSFGPQLSAVEKSIARNRTKLAERDARAILKMGRSDAQAGLKAVSAIARGSRRIRGV